MTVMARRLLGSFDLDQEGLEFRRLRIAVADRRRQGVGKVARIVDGLESPVNRYADVVHRLAFDLHDLDPLRDHGHGLHETAIRAHLDPVAGLDPHFFRQSFTDLDELLWLHNLVQARVLGPVMKVLGQPIGRGDMRELLFFAELIAVALEHTGGRILHGIRLVGKQRVVGS